MPCREKRFTIPENTRLRRTADIQRVYEPQQSVRDQLLLIFFRKNELSCARFAVAVAKRHGKANVRNRLKRCLREAWRLNPNLFPPGFDYVLVPRRAEKIRGMRDVEKSLKGLAQRFG